jgi:hypothetical protein
VGSTTAPFSQSRSCSEWATGPLPESLSNRASRALAPHWRPRCPGGIAIAPMRLEAVTSRTPTARTPDRGQTFPDWRRVL